MLKSSPIAGSPDAATPGSHDPTNEHAKSETERIESTPEPNNQRASILPKASHFKEDSKALGWKRASRHKSLINLFIRRRPGPTGDSMMTLDGSTDELRCLNPRVHPVTNMISQDPWLLLSSTIVTRKPIYYFLDNRTRPTELDSANVVIPSAVNAHPHFLVVQTDICQRHLEVLC